MNENTIMILFITIICSTIVLSHIVKNLFLYFKSKIDLKRIEVENEIFIKNLKVQNNNIYRVLSHSQGVEMLEFIYERLVNAHGENEGSEYMRTLKLLISEHKNRTFS